MHYRAAHEEAIEDRHSVFVDRMMTLPPPLGWRGLNVPPAPDCGDELGASFEVIYPIPGLELDGRYVFRGNTYQYRDEATYDDKVWITFAPKSAQLDYRQMLHEHLAHAMKAFQGYAGHGYFGGYVVKYEDLHAAEIQALYNRPGVDVNGRNNIFTLNVVQYWDAELCQRALGYGRDEVIKRLTGRVPMVQPLMDGVYTVFNDNPDLTFEEFCAYNDRLKPVLGIA
jgi:hypothetical protein